MITDLVFKEYKQTLDRDSSIWRTILKIIGSIIGIGCFVALESSIFFMLDKKLMSFTAQSSASTLDFLILFLTIMLGLGIFISLVQARKVLYQRKDSEILLHLPVVTEEVVLSKIIFIYLNEVLINFIVSFPLLVCYGSTRGMMPSYYVLSALYPVFVSLFTCGITLILVSPFNYIYKFLKGKVWLQIILGTGLVIGMCFGYKYVLELFINLVNNSKLDAMFSAGFLNGLHNASSYFVPVSNLVKMTHVKENIVQNVAIFLGTSVIAVVLGFIVTGFSYSKFLKKEFSENRSTTNKVKVNAPKMVSPLKALIKKEYILLFRNSNYIFSFTALLIMQPFLAYVVISTMSSLLYKNMEMFLKYFPEMINGLNIALILIFASVIATSAMDVFSREERALIVSKYVPISPIKQTLVKIMLPVSLSLLSLFVTSTVLVGFKEISVKIYFISLFLGILLVISLAIAGVYIDLKKLNSKKTSNIGYLSTVLSVIVPILLLGIHALMTFYRVSGTITYVTLFAIMIALAIPLIATFKFVVNKNFKEMRIN